MKSHLLTTLSTRPERLKRFARVVRCVSKVTGVAALDIIQGRPTRNQADARMMAWYLIRLEMPEATVREIGHAFEKDHTTVSAAVGKAKTKTISDEEFRVNLAAARSFYRQTLDKTPPNT